MAILLITQATPVYATQNADKSAETTTEAKPKKDKYGLIIDAESAVVLEAKTGKVIYSKSATKKQYPASITKIMTVLLVLENAKMDEVVTFSKEAVFGIEPGSSNIGITPGEKLTIKQCLYGIMLESANEVSWAVAEHISGTQEEFAKLMTKRAKELGCKNTNFVNAHGLHDKKHYTTAYDIALITKEAMKYPQFKKISGTINYTIPKTNKKPARPLWNHHKMVKYKSNSYSVDGVEGGKTGYTSLSRGTLVTFAKQGDLELICVVMRCEGLDTYYSTQKLLNYGFKKYKMVNPTADIDLSPKAIAMSNPILNNFYEFNKDTPVLDAYIDNNYSILVSSKMNESKIKKTLNISLDTKNKTLGSVDFTYNNKKIGSTPIHFTNDLTQSTIVPTENGVNFKEYLPYILIGAAGFLLFIIIIVSIILHRRRKRLRRYRGPRRRY